MDFAVMPTLPVEAHLLQGCCREAERAELTALSLDGLRMVLPESFHGHMILVSEEIRNGSLLLRDLADRSQVHIARVPVVLDYLNVVLPCLSRSLRDIQTYIDDKTLSREIRWRKMYNKMTEEAGGLPLPQRFVLYNHFLTMLKYLLTRSTNFDLNTLEILRNRILQLREQRGIPPPPLQVGPLVRQELMLAPLAHERSSHWAEQIFSLPLPSRTGLKHIRPSRSYGPHFPLGGVSMPADSRILFKRSFNDDKISLMVFLNPVNQSPYLLIRTFHQGNPWFSLRGAHELCISREGSALQLKRWSRSEHCSKLWAVLFFLTWEEMVLFYCTFVALKARNTLTVQMHPDEYKLAREKRLFQAQVPPFTNTPFPYNGDALRDPAADSFPTAHSQIIDDGYKHSLIVYEDQQTHGLRLHAAVWEGELRQCPVWTAFVTHQSQSPTWLSRRSKHRIWLKDVALYVFCQKYRQENMRQNKAGAFEINFVSEEAASRFKEVFLNTITPESSEANGPIAVKDEPPK